jgi:SAM-dependent methyltransferase
MSDRFASTAGPADDATRLATDRQHLTTSAYATADNLAARQAIYAYQQPRIDFPAWALDQAPWRGGETALDVGCGNGGYLRRLAARPDPPSRLLGFDLSRGMLEEVRRAWEPGWQSPRLTVADIQSLPLPDGVCDVALAMHMLYHVPDIGRAAAELRRVLRPGGVLLAATNGEGHLREMDNLINRALVRVTGHGPTLIDAAGRRFSLETGVAPLRTAFAAVERRDAVAELLIPDPAPVVRYAASMSTLRALLSADADWAAALAEVGRLATAEIAAHGAFRVATHAGVFVCS